MPFIGRKTHTLLTNSNSYFFFFVVVADMEKEEA